MIEPSIALTIGILEIITIPTTLIIAYYAFKAYRLWSKSLGYIAFGFALLSILIALEAIIFFLALP